MTASAAAAASAPPVATREQAGECFHCGLPVPSGTSVDGDIAGVSREFCCPGCRAVCQTIHDTDLQGFYQRVPSGQSLAPPPASAENLAVYDLDEVQAEFVPNLGRRRRIHLLVEGIHCAACVWLIEKYLLAQAGVLSTRVNLSGRRMSVEWDNETIHLSSLLAQLRSIGYAAVPYNPEIADGRLKAQNRALLLRMAFAAFAMMNLMWISIALYGGADQSEYRELFHWVSLILATPVLFYSGYPFLRSAWTGLLRQHLTMDLPIAIGAVATWGYSVFVTLSGSTTGAVYFDTVVNFLFVILVGRYLEAMSRRHAVSSTQRLLDLQPRAASVLVDGVPELKPLRAVRTWDLVLVKPGERMPVDGYIVDGRSSIDESMLSGESVPVSRCKGDRVAAGTMNLDGTITVSVEGVLRNTSLGRIIDLVEEAQASRAPIQCTADRIVPWFVGVTLVLATMTFAWWLQQGFETALMTATAVLIITCPCAFGLATPMAVAAASGLGARNGVLVKNGGVLETLAAARTYVFDKTGTLTAAEPRVEQVYTTAGNEVNEWLGMVVALERFSEHPLARAIVDRGNAAPAVCMEGAASEFENLPGMGITGKVGDRRLLAGSVNLLTTRQVALDDELMAKTLSHESRGSACIQVAVDGRHTGLIVISDPLRPGADRLVRELRQQGCRLMLLSGDRQAVAEAIAAQLGGMDVIAEVLPQHKEQVIRDLQNQRQHVVMIGDGINDAPALSRADVGISLGSGTDISGDCADIVLMSNEIGKISFAARLSRRTLNTIWQNIAISITYNIIMVPLAMSGFITPLVAAISMPISSLLVIANAARINTLLSPVNKREDR